MESMGGAADGMASWLAGEKKNEKNEMKSDNV
jgi:hypothetical protein